MVDLTLNCFCSANRAWSFDVALMILCFFVVRFCRLHHTRVVLGADCGLRTGDCVWICGRTSVESLHLNGGPRQRELIYILIQKAFSARSN